MGAHIKIQHLADTREIEICLEESLQTLKTLIHEIYSIPPNQQTLIHEDRNISTSSKPLVELGLKDGSVITVKKIHTSTGQSKGLDLSSLMKNPMMKSMLKNPETIKSMKKMFPDFQDDINENKTLSMLINNGGLEDELEKMADDGDYMSTQLRNADLTMSKLENIPGGINMMSSMMKDVESPFKRMVSTPEIRSGNEISNKMTGSIPGGNKKNALVEYRKQLSELREIGFENTRENIEVLKSVNGDLQAALEILIARRDKL